METATATGLCFVVGPIGDESSDTRRHADWLLDGIINPTFKANFPNLAVERADKIAAPGMINAQVINRLFSAELVIGDLTSQNANAFYEIAIRHMKRLPIIHMIAKGQTIPFDVQPHRALPFSYETPRDIAQACADLKNAVDEVLKEGFVVENPVTHARGRFELEERGTPEMKLLADEIGALRTRLEDVEAHSSAASEMAMRALGSPPSFHPGLTVYRTPLSMTVADSPSFAPDANTLASPPVPGGLLGLNADQIRAVFEQPRQPAKRHDTEPK